LPAKSTKEIWKQGFLFFETKAKIYEVYASSKEDAKWEF
jgi:hypothetical protein